MIVGLLFGLLTLFAVALGLGVMLAIPLGFFNRFLRVTPDPAVAAQPKSELLAAILALNDERRPWEYGLSQGHPRADIIAEWKVADVRWWGAFNRNGFQRSYRALVGLDEGTHELRITEEMGTTEWRLGSDGPTPVVHWARSFFRGVILFERTKEVAFGMKDELPVSIGEIYSYDFDPWRVKAPLLRLALQHGWSYAPVVHAFQLGPRRPR